MAPRDSRSRSPPPRSRTRYADESSRSDKYSERRERDRDRDRRDDDSRAYRESGGSRRRDQYREDDRERSDRRGGRDEDPSRGGISRRERSPPNGAANTWGRQRRNSRSRSPRAVVARPRSKSRSGSKSPGSPEPPKDKPNFAPSGLLAAATNTVKLGDGTSTVLKYNEPPEARKPQLSWRLYVFKGDEQVELLHIHRQSAYLIGRDKAVADIPIDHPSCSKQHAVIQYRHVDVKDEWGNSKPAVKPFVIDLESTNGTFVNKEEIPPSRYYELKASDVISFGQSTREYVLLHDDA